MRVLLYFINEGEKMCFNAIINYFKDRNQCFNELIDYKKNASTLMIEYQDLEKKYDELYNNWETLNDANKPSALEVYWNNKRPKTDDYIRKIRTILNKTVMVYVDPRIFFNATDNVVPIVTGTNDEKAYKALQLVIDLTTYTSDASQFKQEEEWLFPYETLQLEHGDCEDGAILMANIMLKSGIPYWRIRLNAGDVRGGGHCWCTYLRESDNQFVLLDWCYWPEESLKGLLYKDAEKY